MASSVKQESRGFSHVRFKIEEEKIENIIKYVKIDIEYFETAANHFADKEYYTKRANINKEFLSLLSSLPPNLS